MVFIYDASGSPIGFQYRNEATYEPGRFVTYWYMKNMQGDIVAVCRDDGVIHVTYTYDAWGNVTTTYVNGGYDAAAYFNPFKYRGYYHDSETGFYYLNSRYYDPATGRFINADSVISGSGASVQGYNLFAYCFNNPVNMTDSTGGWPKWIEDVANWVDNNIVKPTVNFIEDVADDISKFDLNNESEDDVLSSNYFSAYKGAFVLKLPIGGNAASFGIIILGDEVDATDVRHEYGHIVQLRQRGLLDYTVNVAIPSATFSLLAKMHLLPYDYYGSPWESEADELGEVNRSSDNTPWPDDLKEVLNGVKNEFIALFLEG